MYVCFIFVSLCELHRNAYGDMDTFASIKWAHRHVKVKNISEVNLVDGRTQRFLPNLVSVMRGCLFL